ncbi:hypothetical protein POTOM_050952 [Populus tomentosa]|uniref:Uncharacterized protein n=1 Tax=Populus tomentosa TaxID=118781 RepID=A0A8X7YBC7_POPTO|nr:hypothetical protein POTOM_050952 [Populus tomentosa]
MCRKFHNSVSCEFCNLTASFDGIKDMSLDSECVSWLERLKLNNCAPTCEVMVRSCLIGVEVVISNGFEEQFLFLLSRMTQMLLEGLNVISCISDKVNQSVLIVNEVISYLKKDKLQVEGLSKMIGKGCDLDLVEGIHLGSDNLRISRLRFADDTLIFSSKSLSSI